MSVSRITAGVGIFNGDSSSNNDNIVSGCDVINDIDTSNSGNGNDSAPAAVAPATTPAGIATAVALGAVISGVVTAAALCDEDIFELLVPLVKYYTLYLFVVVKHEIHYIFYYIQSVLTSNLNIYISQKCHLYSREMSHMNVKSYYEIW
jgi:hypothetical protein